MPSRRSAEPELRIVGGQWRSRRLGFPALPGLRPTPDRVRETLFNWLAPIIEGARCLDLFAGSGALGLEALSRGAAGVVFVERDHRAARALRSNLAKLGTTAEVHEADAMDWLQHTTPQPFNIVLLDPPFGLGLLDPVCATLAASGWLAAEAMVYLESEPGLHLQLPTGMTVVRDKRAGQVAYRLVRHGASGS